MYVVTISDSDGTILRTRKINKKQYTVLLSICKRKLC